MVGDIPRGYCKEELDKYEADEKGILLKLRTICERVIARLEGIFILFCRRGREFAVC